MTALGDPRDVAGRPATTNATAPLLWVNGQRADPTLPQLSALDRGFTLADGLFETMRSYGGVIFRLDAHLARLASGARVLGIAVPPGLRELIGTAARTAMDAGWPSASIRLTLSRGPGGAPGVAPSADAAPTTIVTAFPVGPLSREMYERGLSAQIAAGRRNEHAPSAGLKTTAYADAVIALAAARAAGADDALFFDSSGHLSEATASNLFLVLHGTLVTPPVTCGALPGITRASVLACARLLDIAAEERLLLPESLHIADEAFLTSSVRGLVPLVRIRDQGGDEWSIGDGAPGVVTRRLMEGYAELVRVETTR